MREQLKALSKETLIYGVSTVIGRFLNFLLVPFYVNVLRSSAEYGIATSLYAYLGFLNVIYPLGLEAAFFRYGARPEGEAFDSRKEKKVFSSPFVLIFLTAAILSAVILIFASRLVVPVFHDPKVDITPMTPMLTTILQLGAGILFFDSLAVLPFAVLRLEHRAFPFAAIRLAGIVLTLVLNFIFILGFHWGVTGIFLANLAASVLMCVMLLPTTISRFTWRIDGAVLKKLVPFGLTNVPANLASMMVQVIDRPIVQAFLGLGVLGVYQANYRMGFVMMVFVSLFEYAWRPFFMRQSLADDAKARLIFSRVFTYFMVLALIGFLGLSWGLPYILTVPMFGYSLLKKTYWAGIPIIPVVLLAYVFQGMYTNFIAGVYIKEKNKTLPFITALGAAVNILVNLWLIPRFGIMGAALATLFAYMAMAGSIYAVAQRAYPVPYEWRRVGLLSAVVGAAYLSERLLNLSLIISSGPERFLVRLLLFGGAIGALFIFRFFSAGERAALARMFSTASSNPTPE